MRRNAWQLLLLVVLAFAPGVAYAQSSITGVVRDTSGAVLPGVTVEASSDVLIEKVRTAVTDSSGVYRIVDLRPGSYAVSFTLPGFKTYKRDGLVLASEFTATVNADMAVGGLEETITVTGESPIVDVQSARVQTIVDRDVLTAIPSSRSANGIQALIPGLSSGGDNGGVTGGSGGMAGFIHGRWNGVSADVAGRGLPRRKAVMTPLAAPNPTSNDFAKVGRAGKAMPAPSARMRAGR